MSPRDAFAGVLLGTAAGDSVGLPREGLSGRRARRMFGGAPLRQRLVLGRGMVSDDTEHACMAGQALLGSGGEVGAFARSLGWRLRGWLAGLPAGVGLATGRAIFKLWVGFGPARSGVASAGNGPAMRAAVLGVWSAARDAGRPDADARLRALVRAGTRVTHTDPRADEGAMAVALAARHGATRGHVDPADFLAEVRWHASGDELLASLADAERCLAAGDDVTAFVVAAGVGGRRGDHVGGYVNHTVPACLYAWLLHGTDVRAAVESVVLVGGDADTTGAVAGALAGATGGASAVPADWLDGIAEWPRSTAWVRRLAGRLADGPDRPVPLFWPGLVVRNAVFLAVVLAHGFRRLLPPY